LLMMTEKGVGALVVVEGDQIAGIISERDFIHSIAEKERCVLNTVVLEYMTTSVLTVTPDQSIEDCMQLMTDKHIRHLPVVDNGKLVGMISIGDIVKDIISSEKSRINALENYIEGRGYGQ
jgi:CBS domain-containing protein